MSIMTFGNNSFIAVKGLKERVIEAEAEDSKFLRRLNRWATWSKEKRQRFHDRYSRWLLHRLITDPTIEDYAGYDARRRLQLGLRRLAEHRRQKK